MNFIAIKLSSAFTRFKYLQIYIIFIKMFCHMGRDPFCHPLAENTPCINVKQCIILESNRECAD